MGVTACHPKRGVGKDWGHLKISAGKNIRTWRDELRMAQRKAHEHEELHPLFVCLFVC